MSAILLDCLAGPVRHGLALLPANVLALQGGDVLALLPGHLPGHGPALGAWDAPALLLRLLAAGLLLDGGAQLPWHVPALLVLHSLALLDGHVLAILPGNLARHIVADLGGDVTALLLGHATALLLGHIAAHLPGHVPALLFGNLQKFYIK